ncbi:MAG TPA: hypothetical protein VM286_03135 [Candidatus Thermoplasmatota archaeon]|nr:hypothetical protein [Candidatus Thermoplasmatota archaeon]
MLPFDPGHWTFWTTFLYCLGAVYLGGFFVYLVVFAMAGRRLRAGGSAAAYNKVLRGFPNGFYAKMMGKRPQ